MAKSLLARNLRDGQLTVRDGSGSPKEAIVVLPQGDLSWTETNETIEIKPRGSIANGHIRRGNDMSVDLSFSAQWTQLIQGSLNASDGYQFYEMFNETDTDIVSTSGCGQQFTLELEFIVSAPCTTAPTTGEVITFAKVYKTTIVCAEGNEFNTVSFTGKDFERRPTITRDA